MYHFHRKASALRLSGAKHAITNLDVAPPVRAHGARALREINLLVWVRGVEGILVRDASSIAVERHASERALSLLHLQTDDDGQIPLDHITDGRGCKNTHDLDGVPAGVAPVVVVANDSRARESVVVHQCAQSRPDLRL